MRRFICLAFLLIAGCYPAAAQRSPSSDPFRKYVKRLPEVDRIDVAELKPVLSDKLKDLDCRGIGLVCAPDMFPYQTGAVRTLRGAEAIAVTKMWRAQRRDYSPGDDGCLTPDYLLRFFKADKLVLQTQVCALCHEITLPKLGAVRVEGPFEEPFYDLQNWLVPDEALAELEQHFTEKMRPKVGQQISVIGLIGLGKGADISYDDWQIGIEGVESARLNELLNLGCHTAVKVTGVLRYYVSPREQGLVTQQRQPDHFYFERPQIEVIRVAKLSHRKPQPQRR